MQRDETGHAEMRRSSSSSMHVEGEYVRDSGRAELQRLAHNSRGRTPPPVHRPTLCVGGEIVKRTHLPAGLRVRSGLILDGRVQ